jgi:hypothetical protein
MFGGKKKKQRLEAAGVDANAVLVSLQDTGMTVNDNPRVKLTFEVQGANGPFQVEAKQTVSRVQIPQPGGIYVVRYDPEDPSNFEILGNTGQTVQNGGAPAGPASASDVASAMQAGGGSAVKTGSAAELLATGQRMVAVVKEFSDTGKKVGDQNPAAVNPTDPVYVLKVDLQVDGSTLTEALFMHRVPPAHIGDLRLGARLNVAVNPANPSREVAIDWGNPTA